MPILKKQTRIAIVIYPDALRSAIFGLQDLFTIANTYAIKGDLAPLSVTEITVEAILEGSGAAFDVVILPPSLSPQGGAGMEQVHNWLKVQHDQGAIMCSVCAGVFWLGRSGLLDGRAVTTHWLLEDQAQTKFPQSVVNGEHILIDDNDIITAGGLMAWIDLGFFLVSKYLGTQITSDTARHLLIDPGGRDQKNYRSFSPPLNHGDQAILKVQHWLEGNFAEPLSMVKLAEKAGLAERTFLRRFKAVTHMAPSVYIQNLRVEKARGLLERTRLSVHEISWQVGYQDASAFIRVFKEITGLQPGRYRERFKV